MNGISPHIAQALAHFNNGEVSESRALLEDSIARNPLDVQAILMLVEVYFGSGEKLRAAEVMDDLIARIPPVAGILFRRGALAMQMDHQQLSRAGEAEAFFTRAVSADPSMAQAHMYRAIAMQIQTRHVDGIPHYRKSVLLDPGLAQAVHELAKALFLDEKVELSHRALQQVLILDPGRTVARKDLDDLCEPPKNSHPRHTGVRFPNKISEMQDVASALKKHVLSANYPQVLGKETQVVTFGSCFAGNVARGLREAGVAARNTTMGEFVNSTSANRHYIDWVVNGTENSVTRGIVEYHAGTPDFSGHVEDHRDSLATADLVIMTIGVAPSFFRRDTGELVMPRPSSFNLRAIMQECEFRTTSVEENAQNIEFIMSQIRKINPGASMVITVSPVPMTVTFEYDSAFVADCVSKSTLRVAVDMVMRRNPEQLIYWPSFEIVRWLGSYVPGMFGEEDGSTIHVSERAIRYIVEAFIENLSGGLLSIAPSD